MEKQLNSGQKQQKLVLNLPIYFPAKNEARRMEDASN